MTEEPDFGILMKDTFVDIGSNSYGTNVQDYQSQMDDFDLRGPNAQFLASNASFDEPQEPLPGGGVTLSGYIVELIDGSIEFIDNALIEAAIENQLEETGNDSYVGNMSIECIIEYSYKISVFSLSTAEYKPFDGIGDAQTKARIPIFVEGNRVSIGGYFRETFTSINYGLSGQVNAQPVLSFLRIS